MAEVAQLQGSSERTVQRQWEKARALLYRALFLIRSGPSGDDGNRTRAVMPARQPHTRPGKEHT